MNHEPQLESHVDPIYETDLAGEYTTAQLEHCGPDGCTDSIAIAVIADLTEDFAAAAHAHAFDDNVTSSNESRFFAHAA